MADIKPHIEELEAQLDFMLESLETSRKKLDGAPLVITYDNGGGQTGIRKNPAFDAYNSLMKTYIQTLSKLQELLGSKASTQPKMVAFAKYAKTMKRAADE